MSGSDFRFWLKGVWLDVTNLDIRNKIAYASRKTRRAAVSPTHDHLQDRRCDRGREKMRLTILAVLACLLAFPAHADRTRPVTEPPAYSVSDCTKRAQTLDYTFGMRERDRARGGEDAEFYDAFTTFEMHNFKVDCAKPYGCPAFWSQAREKLKGSPDYFQSMFAFLRDVCRGSDSL